MENDNKIVVLTGATSGIGLATAEAVCHKGGLLIGIGRSEEKCERVEKELSSRYANAQVAFFAADLSSLKNIRALAEKIKAKVSEYGQYRIDALINNAGTFTSWYMSSAEGFELQFAVNHLAPFLLTHLLFPLLKNSKAARVITVSSGSHYNTRMNWKDISLRRHYNCLAAYKQSKLANVLFTNELKERIGDGFNIKAIAADPGLVNTEMGLKNTSGIAKWIWNIRKNSGVKPSDSAKSIVYLVWSKEIQASEDIYFKECKPKKPSREGVDKENSKRLWEISERMCGINSCDFGL